MTLRSNGWDVRKSAKFRPNLAKNSHFLTLKFSQKVSKSFERNFPKSFFTILESYMCNGIKSMGLPIKNGYVRNIAEIGQNWTKNQPKLDFFRFSLKLLIPIERKFLQSFYTILESYMCNGINIVQLRCKKRKFLQSFYIILESISAIASKSSDWDVRNIAKASP